jgi:hypothetical protein
VCVRAGEEGPFSSPNSSIYIFSFHSFIKVSMRLFHPHPWLLQSQFPHKVPSTPSPNSIHSFNSSYDLSTTVRSSFLQRQSMFSYHYSTMILPPLENPPCPLSKTSLHCNHTVTFSFHCLISLQFHFNFVIL